MLQSVIRVILLAEIRSPLCSKPVQAVCCCQEKPERFTFREPVTYIVERDSDEKMRVRTRTLLPAWTFRGFVFLLSQVFSIWSAHHHCRPGQAEPPLASC